MSTREQTAGILAYNFIDDAFVGVEIEGQTGIAIPAMISG